MPDKITAQVIFLEDESTTDWKWLVDEIAQVGKNLIVKSDPISLAKWSREKVKLEPMFANHVIFVIDALIKYTASVEDWEGKEWPVETSDTGIHFFDLFVRHKHSPFSESVSCILTQRRLDDGKIQSLISNIDHRLNVTGGNETRIFQKMVDSDVRDFLTWLEKSIEQINNFNT